MFKNYFIIAWRNLTRTTGYAFINIIGLAIGMAVALLIGLWVLDELNFNKAFKNHERLGLLYHHVVFGEQVLTINDVPMPIGTELKNNCGDLEEVAMVAWAYEHVIGYQETTQIETGLFVEPQFADMFSVQMLEGSAKGLKDVHAVLVSKTLAADLLGENPVGKTIKSGNHEDLMVAGVFEDFPANSQFAEVRMLLPMAYYFSRNGQQQKLDNWDNFDFECYVLLREHASFAAAEPKIKSLLLEKASGAIKALKPDGIILPLEKWHLQATFKDGVNIGGQIRFVWMVGTIGIFVLLLACINFMNLSTARSEKRSKEVGVRKVMGSLRWQLVSQFLSESLMTVTVSFVTALLIAALCLPWFNSMAEKKMLIPWTDFRFILISFVFMVVTSVLAGSYPALYLSSFNPVKVLKGIFRTGSSAGLPRKVMVVFQFTISIALIIGTVVVFLQIQHAKNRPVGFDREGIIHMAIRTEALAKADYNTLRHELLSSGAATDMAKSDFPITGAMSDDVSLTWEGKDPTIRPLFGMNSCSHDFPQTNGFQFIEGRDFSREITSDSSAVIVNEMAAKLISSNPVNPKNPGQNVLGKRLTFADNKERVIIGVIRDQIRWTPFVNQTPHLYYINYGGRGHLTIRLNPNISTHEALERTEAVIKKYDPLTPFDYKFQDDEYARLFKSEERVGKLATVFATLAIFISCIGIFGLAAFAVSQRIKEIGIRKVLGASALSLWKMLSGDFVRLVMISILVAVPVSYYFADEWLQQYDYRIELPWWVFVLTGALAIMLTLITVSYQSIKAAMVNPVKSLRSE